jgi:hypothetical protein
MPEPPDWKGSKQVMHGQKKSAILEVYQLVLAVFLFVSPWLFAFAHGSLRIDTWVSAALVAIISFVALIAFRDWEEWINCILGLWIAVSPWVLGFQHTRAMFVNLAVGILIAYLAMLELWLTHYRSPSEKTT